MNFLKYYRYFLLVLRNWNLRLALFTVHHEVRGEKKYGINTTGVNDLQHLEVTSENKQYAFIYQPANYFMLEKAFAYIRDAGADGSLVDYGSGMGRIMVVAAAYGFKDIKGVEFASELCKAAQQNIEKVQKNYPDVVFKIHCCDATEYEISQQDRIFTFFNPFDERVMLPVVRNLLKSLKEFPRKTFILYFNPTEKEIFKSAGFEEILYYKKMNYLDFSILLWTPEEDDDSIE